MHSKSVVVALCVLYVFVSSVESKPAKRDVPDEIAINEDYLPKQTHVQKVGRKETKPFEFEDLENPTFSEHNENGVSDEDLNSSTSPRPSRVGFGHLLKALAIWNAAREYNLYGNKKFTPNTDSNQQLLT